MLIHRDLQYSQESICKYLCGCVLCNQHIQHTGRDPHIFHCCISVCCDNQNCTDIHTDGSCHMDFLCSFLDICSRLYVFVHCKQH
jgi:hypothetical protein